MRCDIAIRYIASLSALICGNLARIFPLILFFRHINLGKAFQARVKKWSPREISDEERDSIPDRDDLLFTHKVVEHIPQRASMYKLKTIHLSIFSRCLRSSRTK
jgi:hypothetical protein